MSRSHAVVSWADRWLLEDLGTLNGTRVDGVRLEPGKPVPLRDGAEVVFGSGPAWTIIASEPSS